MTGDESAIGCKFGITFVGQWVWKMKDFIDVGFMKLFDPVYLFNDYANKGTSEPVENKFLFDDEKEELEAVLRPIRENVKTMDGATAAKILGCPETETDFQERLIILTRMHFEKDFEDAVVANFKPTYFL